jgi:PTS system nitrogen regulatory IIA component
MFHSKQAKNLLKLDKLLDPDLVIFLSSDQRSDALETLVDLLDKKGKLSDKQAFLNAIIEREKIVSTAIGMGVALPHAKLPEYKDFFIAVGIHPRGIAWDALDQVPVRLVFLIGGPDDQQTRYLQLLSKLTLAVKDEERRKKILQLREPKDIIALFEGI